MKERPFRVKRDVKNFVGWKPLDNLLKRAKKIDQYPYRVPSYYPESLVSTLFLTGLRIREVIPNKTKEGFTYGLRKKHFDLSGKYHIQVSGVPILKKWEYICLDCDKTWQAKPFEDEFEEHDIDTKRIDPESAYRSFRISKEMNVLTEVFVGKTEKERIKQREDYEERNSKYYNDIVQVLIDFVKESNDGLIFPDLSYYQSWNLCRRKIGKIINEKTPPHWFRAQRACQLAVEQNADILDLLEWFQWDDESTAHHYASIERPPDMKSGRVIG